MLGCDHATVAGRLTDATFEFPDGARIAVIGRSGAGKTTLISLFTGVLAPDSGSVRTPEGAIGYVPQDPGGSLSGHVTVADNVVEPVLIADGRRAADRARETLPGLFRSLDLDPAFLERRVSQLSGGQCQRVAIARALVSGPSLLIADEAFSALDEHTGRIFEETLSALDATVLLVTHDLALARRFCDHVLVMADGRILVAGPMSALDDATDPAARELIDAARELEAR